MGTASGEGVLSGSFGCRWAFKDGGIKIPCGVEVDGCFQKSKIDETHWANVVCKVVNRENKFQAVSDTVWVCLKSYDLREDNQRGMN